jgi:enoyl-CoA hydratase/carnithine racemase
LVWRVTEPERLLHEANLLADRLVASAPLAQRAMKEVATRAAALAPLEALRFGETLRLVVGGSADATEGLRAVAERRAPRFEGR